MLRSGSGPAKAGVLLIGVTLVVICTSVAGVHAALTINEVLYDPPGPDGAREFVELYNSGPASEDLAGVELLFVNGSSPDDPRVVWVGRAGAHLPPHAWFVVGEAEVEEADVHRSLDLQNGPDALWLRRGDQVLDRLAWGDAPALAEGLPASDPSGRSLGRVPDGSDSQNNAQDFQELDSPSPGGANAEAEAFAIEDLRLDPPWLARPGKAQLEVVVRAVGWQEEQRADLQTGTRTLRTDPLTVARGDTVHLRREVILRAPVDTVWARVGEAQRWLTVKVGPADLLLTEVMARPRSGESEWIEIHNSSDAPVEVAEWAISDSARRPRRLGGKIRLQPGDRAVIGPKTDELFLDPAVLVLRPEGGWPALNQSDSDQGFADELLLYDPNGRVVDWLRWTAEDFGEAGRSLERARPTPATPSLWLPAPRGSSPGRANDAARFPPPEVGLQVRPIPFSPDGDGEADFLHVALRDSRVAPDAVAEVVDLNGDRVIQLEGSHSAEVAQWIWDGRDGAGRRVPWGAYVVRVHGVGSGRSWRRLIAVGAQR